MKLLCVVALAAVLPLAGQNMRRSSFDWWDSPVVKDLNLSPEQLQKVQTTVHDSRSKLIDLHAAVQKAELDVDDAFNAESFDVRRATEAVDRLSAARAETGKALAQLSVHLRAVLTTEQWKELQKRRPGLMRGGMRPGMGMRPGPGGMNGPAGAMRFRQGANQRRMPSGDRGNTPPQPPAPPAPPSNN
jgi:Spy/CpxP family protein refolding chaperone